MGNYTYCGDAKIINEKTYFATNLITQINTQSKNIVGLIESRHSDDLIKKRRENTICFLIGQRCQGDDVVSVAYRWHFAIFSRSVNTLILFHWA